TAPCRCRRAPCRPAPARSGRAWRPRRLPCRRTAAWPPARHGPRGWRAPRRAPRRDARPAPERLTVKPWSFHSPPAASLCGPIMAARKLSLSAIRAVAKRLPDVEEGTSYGTPAWRHRGRLLARLHQDGGSIKIGNETRDHLLQAD